MRRRYFQLPITLLLAIGMATGAYAQNRSAATSTSTNTRTTTVLPVLNKGSGRVEAVLLLEPADQVGAGARWNFRNASLDTAIGLSSGSSLGLLCNSTSGVGVSSLASNHCLLANIGGDSSTSRTQRVSATTAVNLPGTTRLGVSAGTSQGTLPAWLSTGSSQGGGRVEQNDLAIFGQKDIGQEGYVSIAGTFAKAKLVPLAEAAPGIADRWESRSLSIGGGYGAFSANIVGRVVDVPGQPGKLEGVGLGLTWRTPWSGQLTVGAENITTRGKNPFAPSYTGNQDGTVPYIRYEQDL